MKRLLRGLVLTVGAAVAGVLLWPGVAHADNCGSLTDCYFTARSALAALVGFSVLFGVLLSVMLDFIPFVGTGKGVVEAITGEDLVTGQELEWWERVLGVLPILGGLVGAVAAVSKVANAADAASDVARGADRVDDAADAARATNRAGDPYPEVIDPRTGEPMHHPGDDLPVVPKEDRVPWGRQERGEYIKEWYDRGYPTPEGGWSQYDIHHIQPREYGGTNDFENLVPVPRDVHQTVINPWWRKY